MTAFRENIQYTGIKTHREKNGIILKMTNINQPNTKTDKRNVYSDGHAMKEAIKKTMEFHCEHRILNDSSYYFMANQREAKRYNILRTTDSVQKGINYSGSINYFKVNKDHPYFPISLRNDNTSFYPIRKLDMLNIFNKNDVWLAGGAIRSCLDGETPNDFDIFCKTKEAFHRVIEKFSSPMMRNNFKVSYVSIKEDDFYKVTSHDHDNLKNLSELISPQHDTIFTPYNGNAVTSTAKPMPQPIENPTIRIKSGDGETDTDNKNNIELVSFKSTNDVLYKDFKIQVIYNPNNSNDLLTLMDDFDFTICQFGFDGDHFYYSINACKAFQLKQIHINKINYPVSMLRRVSKYGKHGYQLSASEARLIYDAISENDFDENNLAGYID